VAVPRASVTGSFDCVNASLRETFTSLWMTAGKGMKDHEYFVFISVDERSVMLSAVG
jgi:hypothetical protein